jgi:hypothetical protein
MSMPPRDPHGKISPALGSKMDSEGQELVDVVVELEPHSGDTPTAPVLKDSFERAAEPVTSTIAGLGGEVTGKAWLNRTLQAKVPAKRLHELTGLPEIAALDVPHRITPD